MTDGVSMEGPELAANDSRVKQVQVVLGVGETHLGRAAGLWGPVRPGRAPRSLWHLVPSLKDM